MSSHGEGDSVEDAAKALLQLKGGAPMPSGSRPRPQLVQRPDQLDSNPVKASDPNPERNVVDSTVLNNATNSHRHEDNSADSQVVDTAVAKNNKRKKGKAGAETKATVSVTPH
ncbi:hypothetical protein PAXINDRAFT_19698 [Paxillus involutus ATCC 200175]|uniref:Uncharacterized protein n=1 Tax=Paxillus involutus ATCC 200175 TaxID=664439 RepID=A0A0C9T7B8_PAXIN|nr:hypothetical protein PAXINDRAFT_19698 [Paxillus involutus ATCC 200175]